ncbi:MAG: TatD family hydrolase [Alistipes sp.]|nr:TatD family hydrolase [Alistipes sp.]
MARYVNIHTHRPTYRHIEPTSIGIHPYDVDNEDLDSIAGRIGEVQAIGETGLDYIRGGDRRRQLELLRGQLDIARERKMPVILHCVRAFEPLMKVLGEYDLPAVIFHGFIGSPQQAQRAVARGYYLSFGRRTFSSPRTVEALRATPLRNLFLETDDDPTDIEEIYAAAAVIKGLTVERLREEILNNYHTVFGEYE